MARSRQQVYGEILTSGFAPACAVLSALFLGFAVWHPRALSPDDAGPMVVVAAVTAVLFAVAAVLAQQARLPSSGAHQVAGVLATAGFLNIPIQYWLTGQQLLTVNVVLVMVGTGVCLVDPRWTAALVLGFGVTWLAVVALMEGDERFVSAAPNILVGATVAFVANLVRLSTLHRLLDSQAELRALSQCDDLTGLLNRRGFLESAERLLARGRPVRMWFFDVDDLKLVNDSRGHDVGDVLLISVATALSDVFAGGVVARLSGDEFAVLEDHGSSVGRDHACAALQDRLALASSATGLPVSVSTGTVVSEPDQPLGELLSAADGAMYASKQGRRRTIRLPEAGGISAPASTPPLFD